MNKKKTQLITWPCFLIAMALLIPQNAYALAFGFGIGSASLDPSAKSNLEAINPDIATKVTSSPASFNLQVHGGITDSVFFELGYAALSSIEKEQKRNGIPASEGQISSYKVASKESYSAIYGALGFAVFVTERLALYGKAGGNFNETEYKVKQVEINQSNQLQVQEGTALSSDLDRYLAIGALFNLTDKFLLKFDIEDFGVIGNKAKVTEYYLPNTVDNPEASGSLVRRAIVHFLVRF